MTNKQIEEIREQANEITAKYSGWIKPAALQEMYDELENIGVTVGIISGSTSCEWYINGIEIETSNFVFRVHNGEIGPENDYTIYFS